MTPLHVLRVFCGEDDSGGNPLGVFLDGAGLDAAARQRVAADLGFSETVFVEDAATGVIRIHTPAAELPFAGHPSVGTAWLLARERDPVETLRPPAGEVPVRTRGELVCVSALPEWAPDFELLELDSAEEVDALTGPPGGRDLVAAWAWADRDAGTVRERVFPVRLGIDEDEATGAAAVRLGALLGRRLEIHQGQASVIIAEPREDGMVEIGGRVVQDEMREYELG